MARETIDETKALIRRLGDRLGIPPANITDAINKCGDDNEVRALRRKWTRDARSLDHQFARKLRAAEEERWAAEALAQHGERLTEEAKGRRASRERLTLGSRLDAALVGLGCMSTVGSGLRAVNGGRSSERPAGPPPAEQPDVSQETRSIRTLVELLEDRWDAERGLLSPVDYAKMPTADKDRLIVRLTGVRSDQVAEMFPWLGSARTIERRRKELADELGVRVSPTTGLPREAEAA